MEIICTNTTFPSLSSLRLVATDLDGTLLRSDKTISERTSVLLRRLQAAGVAIVLISARPPRSLRQFARASNIGGLAICCNGAIVYDLDQGCLLQQRSLTSQQVTHLITLLQSFLPDLSFAAENGESVSCEAAFYASCANNDPQQQHIANIAEICQLSQTKILVHHATLLADELHEQIAPLLDSSTYSVTYSGLDFLEIASVGVNKGEALEALCTQLGIAAHSVVAFGDMPNDLPLLQWAGLGVAVANAHPLILQSADVITFSNEEDGVAYLLEQLIEGANLP